MESTPVGGDDFHRDRAGHVSGNDNRQTRVARRRKHLGLLAAEQYELRELQVASANCNDFAAVDRAFVGRNRANLRRSGRLDVGEPGDPGRGSVYRFTVMSTAPRSCAGAVT